MSAYIPSPRHIDFLVETIASYGLATGYQVITEDIKTMIGRELCREVVKSVGYRYPDTSFEALPGPTDKERIGDYLYEPSGLGGATVPRLKAISGYEYQACEHPGWGESAPARLLMETQRAIEAEMAQSSRRLVRRHERDSHLVPAYQLSNEWTKSSAWDIDDDTQQEDM